MRVTFFVLRAKKYTIRAVYDKIKKDKLGGENEMKQRIGRQIGMCFLCAFIAFMLFPITAQADIGPKPSVTITFENMGDEICYGTLLSEDASTGPESAWDGDEAHIDTGRLDREIWEAFAYYQDTDGYYFLQEAWLCSEYKCLSWLYFWPDSFKILLYYPETDTYAVSGIYERYAFDSYFSVDMEGVVPGPAETQTPVLIAKKSYDYVGEVLSLLIRTAITILLETGIALLFGFRQKRQIYVIAGVNIVTQIILNIWLNIINYHSGFLAFLIFYFFGEAGVFILEAVLHCILLNRVSEKKIPLWKTTFYALIANVGSFICGIYLVEYHISGTF